jgi:hypothetical protein
MWSSIMELTELDDSRILTIDVVRGGGLSVDRLPPLTHV